MATRTSFRPRPVDISRQLNIVRDVAELDNTDDIDTTQNQVPATTFEQAPAGGQPKKKKEVKEIPVPEVRIVPGYTREYLPIFRIPETYIRGKGGVGWAREDYCEYDLDNEDEDWLEAFNAGGANRLSDDKFEQMLWRLEVANSEANQRLLSEPGYAKDWSMLPAAVAATGNMSREEALSVLRKYACARDPILHAVYDYWRGRRERWGKPIMRRLQAPTNPSDTNPYNVFRPRERVNRPQTRRRRENTQDCLDKMRQIRESMLKSLELTELLTFREARKRDIHRLDVDMQRYQVARHHQPPHLLEAIEAEGTVQLQEAQARSRQGETRLRAYLDSATSLGGPTISYDSPLRRALLRKRRRQEMEGCVNGEAIARLPPPPLPPDEEMLLLFSPDLSKLAGQPAAVNGGGGGSSSKRPPLLGFPPGLDRQCVRSRVSRCGRTMLTRCDPFSLEPHPPAPPPQPSELGPDGGSAPPSPPLSARHPLLHSFQIPSLPWAAVLDLELLPEGIADKAALKTIRERRINADRLNTAMLRGSQQPGSGAAAGATPGAAGAAPAGAAAAAAGVQAGTGPAAAQAAPAPAASRPPPPPPPTAVVTQGAPAGTLPHIPQQGAPAGTLPHVPSGSLAGTPAPGQNPAGGTVPAPAQAGAVGGGAAATTSGAGSPGALAGAAAQPPAAPASAAGQARKVPKVAGAAGTPSGEAPTPAGAAGGTAAIASSGAAPSTATAVPPAPTAGAATPHHHPPPPAGATPGPTSATPSQAGQPSAGTAPPGPAAAAAATPGTAGPSQLAATPGTAAGAGAGTTVKKMLPTSKAVAGPSSASQLKRGPGRPPKAAKASPNGDAPPASTTVPMDML